MQHPKGAIPVCFPEPRHGYALAILIPKCFPVSPDPTPWDVIDNTAIGAKEKKMGVFMKFLEMVPVTLNEIEFI